MKLLFAILFFLCMSASAHANPVVIGGYDVSKIAADTLDILTTSGRLSTDEIKELKSFRADENSDPFVASPLIVAFYDDLFGLAVECGIATQTEINSVKELAAASGGIKSDGQNPVVLAAAFLDILNKKGLTTVSRAQAILDNAKIH